MPLSEHEQRLLDQIERALYAEDPKFASTVRGARLRKPSRRRKLQGIVLLVVGAALLVTGVMLPKLGGVPVVSLLGFLIMFGGALLAWTSFRRGDKAAAEGEGEASDSSAPPSRSNFSQRMEERFRKRFDEER